MANDVPAIKRPRGRKQTAQPKTAIYSGLFDGIDALGALVQLFIFIVGDLSFHLSCSNLVFFPFFFEMHPIPDIKSPRRIRLHEEIYCE